MKRNLIVVMLIIMAFAIPVSADVRHHFEITVASRNIMGINTFDGYVGERFYGSFEVISGTDITLVILNDVNYIEFFNERDYVSHYIIENVASSDFEFEYPYNGEIWHVVLNNRDSNIAQVVEGDYYEGDIISSTETTTSDTTTDETTTETTTTGDGTTTDGEADSATPLDIDPLLIIAIVGLGAVCVIVVALSKRKKEPLKVDAKVLIICPYCGSKTEQGITKCQKCGAEL